MQTSVRADLVHHIALGTILPETAVLFKSFLMSSKSAMVAAMGCSPLFTDQLFWGSKRILGNKKGVLWYTLDIFKSSCPVSIVKRVECNEAISCPCTSNSHITRHSKCHQNIPKRIFRPKTLPIENF